MPYPVDPYNHRATADVAAARLHEWYSNHMNQVTKAAEPTVTKVGPEGYVHGWIKLGPGAGGGEGEKALAGRDGMKEVLRRNGVKEEEDIDGHLSRVDSSASGKVTVPSERGKLTLRRERKFGAGIYSVKAKMPKSA